MDLLPATSTPSPSPGDAPVPDTSADRFADQAAAENFPVALRLLPRSPRRALEHLYAYARFVDDIGDEYGGDRSALLDEVAAQVAELYAGGLPALPPVAGLAPLVERYALPAEPLLDLIEANRVDQVRRHYATFDELLGYCRLSAAPVGRLVLHVAGAATARNVADSDAVCAALQVLEHCQDVGEDVRRGRIYLPTDELEQHGVDPAALLAGRAPEGLRRVVRLQVVRARALLGAGTDLVRRLPGWPRLAVTGFVAGGRATATALERAAFDPLAAPVRPRRRDLVRYAVALQVRR